MGILNKVRMKGANAALKSDFLYRMARERAIGRSYHKLMPADEARGILVNASPRPVACTLPASRDWPEIPEVDISIVVPCYNAEAYIEECILSVLGQKTSRSLEIVAVDDGSDDGTGAILDRLALNDARLRVIHQGNKGFSGARNVGISKARGALISFVDSDDMIEPDAIEILCREYDKGGCDFVTPDYCLLSEDGTRTSFHSGQRNHGGAAGRVYSREVWRSIEFPEGFWFEDTVQAFCIDPLFRGRYIDDRLYLYRQHRESISRKCSKEKKGLDTYWVVEELLDWCKKLGVELGQRIFDQTVSQMGPLMLSRTAALSGEEQLALFAVCCSLLASFPEFEGMQTTLEGRWKDVLLALRTSNYALWRLAAAAV